MLKILVDILDVVRLKVHLFFNLTLTQAANCILYWGWHVVLKNPTGEQSTDSDRIFAKEEVK